MPSLVPERPAQDCPSASNLRRVQAISCGWQALKPPSPSVQAQPFELALARSILAAHGLAVSAGRYRIAACKCARQVFHFSTVQAARNPRPPRWPRHSMVRCRLTGSGPRRRRVLRLQFCMLVLLRSTLPAATSYTLYNRPHAQLFPGALQLAPANRSASTSGRCAEALGWVPAGHHDLSTFRKALQPALHSRTIGQSGSGAAAVDLIAARDPGQRLSSTAWCACLMGQLVLVGGRPALVLAPVS